MKQLSTNRPMIPLILTVFLDLVGLGIAIPVLAVTFLDPHFGVLSADTSFHVRTILYGLLTAVYPFAQFIGAPILGALSDRHGRKPILMLSLLGTLFGYLLFASGIVWGSLWLLFLSRALDGFTGGNISIAMSAIADISSGPKKTRNFGLVGMAFGLGFILGPFIGGKLSDPTLVSWFTLATPFWFAAALTFANIMLFLWLFPETLREKRPTPVSALTGARNVARAFAMPATRVVFVVVFLLTLGFNFFTQFFQVFLIEKFQYTQGDIGNLFAFIGICIAVVQGGITGPVSKRFSAPSLVKAGSFGLAWTFPLLLLPTHSWVLYLIMPLIAICQGIIMPNITTVISDTADRESQGEILGINQSVQSLAMALPPLIAGFIAGFHIALPLLAAGAITLVAWLIFTFSSQGSRAKQGKFHEV